LNTGSEDNSARLDLTGDLPRADWRRTNVIRLASTGAVLLALVVFLGCAERERPAATDAGAEPAPIELVSAPASLREACVATANAVGYPVPCPTQIPPGLRATGGAGPGQCQLDIIGPGGSGGCHRSWRGWVIGSSEAGGQHLVVTGSPSPVRSHAKLVNGPGWYPAAHVRPLEWVTVNGRRTRVVFVPHRTNEGSAFADHVVLIWTVGAHTYGVGFHNEAGIRRTIELDVVFARGVELVGPSP
jgi:hypothetical protein